MKQISLRTASYQTPSESICLGRLLVLGFFFGLAMALLWEFAGPTPAGHAVVWCVAIFAGLKFWRSIEGA